MVTSDFIPEVEITAVSRMRHASGHYRNNSFIVDVAMGQIPRFTERISSFYRAACDADAVL